MTDEVRHGLAYGIAERVAGEAHAFSADDPWFMTASDGTELRATVVCTPPYRPILSWFSGDLPSVAAALAQGVHAVNPTIPGLVGEKPLGDAFDALWRTTHGAEVSDRMAQRIYKLTQLVEPPYAAGSLRRAEARDAETVASWWSSFQREAAGETPPPNHCEQCRKRIESGEIYVWENGVPVAMAARVRPTRHGICVGAVYTPPELRNRGYATSCVAALCKGLLSQYDFCFLYTDLSNPVSNSIYRKMGFLEHCDSVQYSYSYPPTTNRSAADHHAATGRKSTVL